MARRDRALRREVSGADDWFWVMARMYQADKTVRLAGEWMR